MGGRSARMMGMQMMNDPGLCLKKGEEPEHAVNAQVRTGMFVIAIKEIEKGDEIFINCNCETQIVETEGAGKAQQK